MNLLGRLGRGARSVETVDFEDLPAVRIEKSENDVLRLLAGYRVEVVARLDGDPQDRRSLAGGGGNGGRGLLLAAATEAEEQEQAETQSPNQNPAGICLRPNGPPSLSPGQRPGLKRQTIFSSHPAPITQGVALG